MKIASPPNFALDQILQQATYHHKAGRLAEAEALYRQVLSLDSRHADSYHSLGGLALQVGRYDLAVDMINKAIALNSNAAEFHYNLASALGAQGKILEVIASYEQALAIKPDFPEALCDLGDALLGQGRLIDAAARYEEALTIKPGLPNALCSLGNALLGQGKLTDAAARYEQALAIKPDFPEALCNLGDALQGQGKLIDAAARYEQALDIKPDFPEALCNLGDLLQGQGRLAEAITHYEQALAINPDLLEVLCNLGLALYVQGRLTEGIARLEQALSINPDMPAALCNLGSALKAQGKLADGIARFKQALTIKPDFAVAHSNLLLTMQYMPLVTAEEQFEAHQQYAERFEATLKAHWQPHRNKSDPAKKIRIGYVSGDLKNHAVAYFIEPILASHDRSQVEVFCYYNNTHCDDHTNRIAINADQWLQCNAMSDEQLAERIRVDNIDILVDLSGHTAHNRLPVFARKPAPVQATWIGYAGTTGLSAMDYRITDAFMDPPGMSERYHSEALIRLPDTNAAYRPEPGCPPINPLPALTSGALVFASLNNLTKMNQAVVNLWSKILTALPHARLMLGNVTDEGIERRVIDMFAQAGIAAKRLILKPKVSLLDYLEFHHEIDVALDPFPYNGGTTSMHSLWMGVPVLTLTGVHTVSRVGVAVLSRAGLQEFIAHSEDEYLQRALSIAQDLPGLNRIRQSLRGRMSSADSDPTNITRHLETAYRVMWRKWCGENV